MGEAAQARENERQESARKRMQPIPLTWAKVTSGGMAMRRIKNESNGDKQGKLWTKLRASNATKPPTNKDLTGFGDVEKVHKEPTVDERIAAVQRAVDVQRTAMAEFSSRVDANHAAVMAALEVALQRQQATSFVRQKRANQQMRARPNGRPMVAAEEVVAVATADSSSAPVLASVLDSASLGGTAQTLQSRHVRIASANSHDSCSDFVGGVLGTNDGSRHGVTVNVDSDAEERRAEREGSKEPLISTPFEA